MKNLKYFMVLAFALLIIGCAKEGNPQSFYKAAEIGKLDYVQSGVEKGWDINALDKFGTPLIVYAASRNRLEVVNYLIEQNVNVNNTQEKTNVTAIGIASRNGYYEVVEALLEAGADPTIADNSGKNAIAWSEDQQHHGLIDLFAQN